MKDKKTNVERVTLSAKVDSKCCHSRRDQRSCPFLGQVYKGKSYFFEELLCVYEESSVKEYSRIRVLFEGLLCVCMKSFLKEHSRILVLFTNYL